MLRLTLAQMRRSIGRLTAAGVAIVIGTAFVAVTLLAGNIINRSVFENIAAPYANADLIVKGSLDADTLEEIAGTPGVAAVGPMVMSFEAITSSTRSVTQPVIPTTTDPRLMPLTVAAGDWPVGKDEIALPTPLAERLGVEVGGTVTLGSDSTEGGRAVTVAGLLDDPRNAFSRFGGAAVQDAAAMQDQIGGYWTDGMPDEVTIALADGATVPELRTTLAEALPDTVIQTPTEHAQESAARQTGGQDLMFYVFVLTFAAIALLVAGLVITNTFQVLVAQRTRTLAMLRAVGASKRQVGQGVLVEAAILGLVSSLAGVLVGCGLGQVALLVGSRTDAAAYLPEAITITWPVVVLPLVAGTAVTLLSALVPARMATRVAPLAALRPIDGPTAAKGSAGRVRLVLSLLATFGGLALLGAGAYLGNVSHDAQLGLLAGIAGGTISFVGLAVSAVFWLPRIASWSGHLVGLSGPTARLAAANTLRNPRRTAATSTALLIGVTLVAMMSTGAASARHSLAAQLDGMYPVDVVLQAYTMDGSAPKLTEDVVAAVTHVDGVTATARPLTSWIQIEDRYVDEAGNVVRGAPPAGTPESSLVFASANGVDAADAEATVNDRASVTGIAPGTVVVPGTIARSSNIRDGEELTLTGPSGTVTVTAIVAPGSGLDALLLTPENVRSMDARATAETLWARLAGNGIEPVNPIKDAVADINESVLVTGSALDRADFEQVIDIALGVVIGLLAVAVVIALIGVANTLSLSVLERRRESATLRAIGVTRGQLRWMLAVEGMLIAGVGAVLGIALGLVYGWGGSLAGLGVMGEVRLAVPWRDIVLVAVIALVAGLVASVVPGRSAVRPSPVAALATE